MSKVCLISFYDDWTLGLRALANALILDGHHVEIVHFKMPASKVRNEFLAHPLNYENMQTSMARDEVAICSYNIDVKPWTHNELNLLGDVLAAASPDIIGLSTRSVYELYIPDVAQQMRRVPDAVTLVGGFGATLRPEFYTDYFDYVCIGEGEAPMRMIAAANGSHSAIRTIPGLAYSDAGVFHRNPVDAPNESVDHFYSDGIENLLHHIVENNSIMTTASFFADIRRMDVYSTDNYYTMMGRGCINKCTFCAAWQFQRIYDLDGHHVPKRRPRPLPSLMSELELVKKHGFSRIYFMDSLFIAPFEYLVEFFREYKARIGIPFFVQFLPRQILGHPELVEMAVDAGLSHTVIAFQSGSERLCREVYHRNSKNDELIRAAQLLSRYPGVLIDYHVITHNPLETEQDFEVELRLLPLLPKVNAQLVLQKLMAFPGTEIRDMLASAPPLADVEYKRRFALLLIRYFADDQEFEQIYRRSNEMTFHELSDHYVRIASLVEDKAGMRRRAWALYDAGQYPETVALLDRLLDAYGPDSPAFVKRGWAHLQQHDYKAALADFTSATGAGGYRERSETQELYRGAAWAAYHTGDFFAAEEYFCRALEHTAEGETDVLVDILHGRGWASLRMRNKKQARECFAKALGYPDIADALRNSLTQGLGESGPASFWKL